MKIQDMRNHGLFSGKNYKEQAQALENAGYSTVRNADGVASLCR